LLPGATHDDPMAPQNRRNKIYKRAHCHHALLKFTVKKVIVAVTYLPYPTTNRCSNNEQPTQSLIFVIRTALKVKILPDD
jgi:hypothetical protein